MADYKILVKLILDKSDVVPQLTNIQNAAPPIRIKVKLDVNIDDAKIQARIKEIQAMSTPTKQTFFNSAGEANKEIETYNGNLGESVVITKSLVAATDDMKAHWVQTVKYTNEAGVAQQKLRIAQEQNIKLEEKKAIAIQAQGRMMEEANAKNAAIDAQKEASIQKQGVMIDKALADNATFDAQKEASIQKQGVMMEKAAADNAAFDAQKEAAIQRQGVMMEKAAAENAAIDAQKAAALQKISDQYKTFETQLESIKIKNKDALANPAVNAELQKTLSIMNQYKNGAARIEDVQQQFGKLNNVVAQTNLGMQSVNKSGLNLMSMLETAGKKILIWGAGTMLIYGSLNEIRKGIQYIKDLNKELTNLQIVTGASNIEIKILAQQYNDLAYSIGANTLEVAKGSLEWARQGKTAQETASLLKISMMMSKLAAVDSAQASELMTATMNGFKFSVDDMLPALDKLIAVDNAFATSTGEIATAMQYSAAVANQAGVSYDELTAYITTISSVTRMSAIDNFGALWYNS